MNVPSMYPCFAGVSQCPSQPEVPQLWLRDSCPLGAPVGAPRPALKSQQQPLMRHPEVGEVSKQQSKHLNSRYQFVLGKMLDEIHIHMCEKLLIFLVLFSRRFRRKSRLFQWLVFFRQFNAKRPLFVH